MTAVEVWHSEALGMGVSAALLGVEAEAALATTFSFDGDLQWAKGIPVRASTLGAALERLGSLFAPG